MESPAADGGATQGAIFGYYQAQFEESSGECQLNQPRKRFKLCIIGNT